MPRKFIPLSEDQKKFIELLPLQFNRKDALFIAESAGYQKRYFDVAMRKKLFSDKFIRKSQGVYIKI